MQVRNVTIGALDCAASRCGVVLNNLRSRYLRDGTEIHQFTIRPDAGSVQRRLSVYHPWSGKQRRVHAVCWHGHRDFFRFLFQADSRCVVTTAWAKYTAENFESTFPATGYRNTGSQMYPMIAAEACDCPDAGQCR
jgi:hypothetical protein